MSVCVRRALTDANVREIWIGVGVRNRRAAWRMKRRTGFKAEPSVFRLSAAPTGRARCRVCKQLVGKGELRLETCAFVMPGRRTVFVTHATCVTVAQASDVLSVYGTVARVPVGAGVDPERVHEAQLRISQVGALQH